MTPVAATDTLPAGTPESTSGLRSLGRWAARLLARSSGNYCVVQADQYRKELEAAVEERTRELLHAKESSDVADHLKSQFLANMSRELRTPMNGVLGTLELALGTKLTPEQREYIELSRTSARSLLALVDDILDYSSLEAEQLEIRNIEFSLGHCIKGALSTIRGRAEQSGFTIQPDITAGVPDRLRGDPDRLRQVLLKSAEIVMKASSGGRILVSVRRDTDEVKKSAVSDHSLSLLFSVQVNQPQIGRRAPPAAGKIGEGGLNMGLCGHLVRLMEGRLWLDTGSGADNKLCFTARFAIPEVAVPARERPVSAILQRTSMQGARVLVVEDNRVNQVVAVRLLEKRGLSTLVANDGREALAILKGEPVDLVLMDIQMPVLDGYETTRAIREQEKTTGAHLPIIALTAHAIKGDREKCLRAGMDAYLTKPVQGDQLHHAIEELLLAKAS
jgi:CheY-like chemotaxis protein/signal transduction histidine kinase